MFSKFIIQVPRITFILVFWHGWMANNFVLLGASQMQKISQVKLPQSEGNYSRLCFSANSKKLYAVNPSQGTIHTWDLFNAKHQNQISINRPVKWTQLIAFDENILLIADLDGDVWNVNFKKKDFTLLYKCPMHDRDPIYINSMAIDHKRSQLILVRGNGSVEYLKYQGDQITKASRIQLKHESDVKCAVFSKGLANFATVDWNDNLNFLLTKEPKLIWRKKFNKKIYDLSFGLTKELLIISQYDGTCLGINTKNTHVNWNISCRPRLLKTRISQDGNHIYVLVGNIRKKQSNTDLAAFHIHRISDGQLVFQQKLKGNMPKALEVSPDGKFVAALSEGEIYLWNIEPNSSEK